MGEMFVTKTGDKISPEEVRYYLREVVEDYDWRVGRAWDAIDHNRAPLYNVDNALYEELNDRIMEFCIDNDVVDDESEYDELGLDMEDFLL